MNREKDDWGWNILNIEWMSQGWNEYIKGWMGWNILNIEWMESKENILEYGLLAKVFGVARGIKIID